jgi:hypothetical protein
VINVFALPHAHADTGTARGRRSTGELLEHKLRAALITLYWDELLRLAASLRHGWTPRGAAACQGSGRMPLASGGPRLVRAAGAIANVLRPGDFNATERPSKPTADRFPWRPVPGTWQSAVGGCA